jgi:hypothetical protein
VVQHRPSSSAYLDLPLIGQIEDRSVSVQAQLESSRERSRSLCRASSEEPVISGYVERFYGMTHMYREASRPANKTSRLSRWSALAYSRPDLAEP